MKLKSKHSCECTGVKKGKMRCTDDKIHLSKKTCSQSQDSIDVTQPRIYLQTSGRCGLGRPDLRRLPLLAHGGESAAGPRASWEAQRRKEGHSARPPPSSPSDRLHPCAIWGRKQHMDYSMNLLPDTISLRTTYLMTKSYTSKPHIVSELRPPQDEDHFGLDRE